MSVPESHDYVLFTGWVAYRRCTRPCSGGTCNTVKYSCHNQEASSNSKYSTCPPDHTRTIRIYSSSLKRHNSTALQLSSSAWKIEESTCDFRYEQQIILFCKVSRPVLGPKKPPIQLVLGIKWPRREADRLPQSKVEVKKEWRCTTTPPYAFIAFLRTTLALACSLCYEPMRAGTPLFRVWDLVCRYLVGTFGRGIITSHGR
jgi:hypothetical protein